VISFLTFALPLSRVFFFFFRIILYFDRLLLGQETLDKSLGGSSGLLLVGLLVGNGLLLGSSELDLGSVSLGFQKLGSLLRSSLFGQSMSSQLRGGKRVQLDEGSSVVIGVDSNGSSLGGSLSSDNTLDFIRVDDSTDISVGHERSRELVSLLGRRALVGSVDLIELLESILGPDDKSSEMASRS